VGARTKRPIGRGEWLHKGLLTAVMDVAEGGPVLLVYQTEAVRFATPGVALVPAQVGEYIPVRNLGSGKIVYGIVQADESVKVN
jgi:flagella basal body P-ring formation protein FlgA